MWRSVAVASSVLISARSARSHCSTVQQQQQQDQERKHVSRVKYNDKIIHFVRHAEGEHNVAGKKDPLKGYLRADLVDAVLTDQGVAQCQELHNKTANKMNSVELLVVSPMNRTLQTAMYSFPQLVDKLPWIAIESIREQTGLHPCDKRKSIAEHKANFSHVNFDLVASNEDPLYHNYLLREPDNDVAARGREFLQWLCERPEKEIVVVTHSAYLRHLFGKVLEIESDEEKAKFENCEMRTYIFHAEKCGP